MHSLAWISALAFLLYLAAEGAAIAQLRKERASLATLTSLLLLTGFLVHFLALELVGRATKMVPYHGLASSMSLFAWMIAGAYGVLRVIHRERGAGPFLIPVAMLFLGASMLAQPAAAAVPDPHLKGPLFALHVTLAIFGYAALTLAFVLALLYLVQHRQLHLRKTGLLFSRLPALDVLDRLRTLATAYAVGALVLSTLLGVVWAKQHWRSLWDAKVAITYLVIALHAGLLAAPRFGLGGRRAAWASAGGFLLVLFSYTVVNLYLSAEHLYR